MEIQMGFLCLKLKENKLQLIIDNNEEWKMSKC